jgi:hypothetical protein
MLMMAFTVVAFATIGRAPRAVEPRFRGLEIAGVIEAESAS